jgi:hypothetical protein
MYCGYCYQPNPYSLTHHCSNTKDVWAISRVRYCWKCRQPATLYCNVCKIDSILGGKELLQLGIDRKIRREHQQAGNIREYREPYDNNVKFELINPTVTSVRTSIHAHR